VKRAEGSAARLDLATFDPYLGLPRDPLAEGRLEVALADAGLVVVENFACFEAFCRGEVERPLRSTVAWTAGYPGRAVRRLVEVAAQRGAPIRVWADLDLDGVRIARLVHTWSAGTARFHGMTPGDLRSARHSLPLTERAVAGIRADLARHPDAPLADLLRALLEAGRWVEQEAFLG
jgi:DNA topoisomerase VI subunit A